MSSPTQHPDTPRGLSQCAAILRALELADGDWIAMPKLCQVSGSYNVHSRIADLRARGHHIEQHNDRCPSTGKILSSYRLLVGAGLRPAGSEDVPSETVCHAMNSSLEQKLTQPNLL